MPSRDRRIAFALVPLAAVAYVAGQAVAAGVLAQTALEPPRMPPGASAGRLAAWGAVSALISALGLAPLARGLAGRPIARWSVLAAFLYFVQTVNTAIETLIFTKLGGQTFLVASGLPPALLAAAVLTAIPTAGAAPPPISVAERGLAWRLTVAWLAFPAAYFTFGTLIAPLVIDAYSAEDSLILIPPIGTILAVQLIRSMTFLLPTLAVIERWTGTRLGLWLALGWAHTALVGLAGLVLPNGLMPPTLRLTHSLEIAADSFAYAGIVVAALAARRKEP